METTLWGENSVVRVIGIPELGLKSTTRSNRARIDLPWLGIRVDEGEIWLTRIRPGLRTPSFFVQDIHTPLGFSSSDVD